MSKLKKALAGAVVGIAVTGASIVGATPAQASEGVNMHLVCQYTAGRTSYAARVINQTASGWQCYDRAGARPNMGANIWGYCVNVLGYDGAYNTTNNVYGWYCADGSGQHLHLRDVDAGPAAI